MTALRLRCLAVTAAFLASTQMAWPAPPKPTSLNYTCGAWGPSTSRPGFQCRTCQRCGTKTIDGKEAIDCSTIVKKTQCTDGPTDGIDPPADITGGTRPGGTRPSGTIRPRPGQVAPATERVR